MSAKPPYLVKGLASARNRRCTGQRRRPSEAQSVKSYNQEWRTRVFALLQDDGAWVFSRLALDRSSIST